MRWAAAAIPIGLLGVLLWLLLTPAWIHIATRLPGFPADRYGATPDEIRRHGALVVAWLGGWTDDGALAAACFPAGAQAPPPSHRDYRDQPRDALFNDRELIHMAEVRPLVRAARWIGLAAAIAAAAIIWRRRRDRPALGRFLVAGMTWTWGLLAGVAVAAAVAFNPLFEAFHRLFFSIDADGRRSWVLNWSDTLIRCFPGDFWVASGGVLIGGTLAIATVAGLIGRRWAAGPRPSLPASGWIARAASAVLIAWCLHALVAPACRAASTMWWKTVPATVAWADGWPLHADFVFQHDHYRTQAVYAVEPWWTDRVAVAAGIRARSSVAVNGIDPWDAALWPGFAPWDPWLRLAATAPAAAAAIVLWRRWGRRRAAAG